MFNRAIQVKMVKNDKKNTTEPNFEEVISIKFAQASRMMKDITRTIGIAVIGYVVVDTARQMLIAKALKQ